MGYDSQAMAKVVQMPRPADDAYAHLTQQQREAVFHGEGPLLVVAGAGTGKTRVITERICYLLESQPQLSGANILGLTFTDKAAAEMKARVMRAVGERGANIWLGTFHRFCQTILQQLYPELQVFDEIDHWILLRRNLRRLQLEQYKHLAEPGRFLSDFVKFFSRCQDELVTPDDYQRHADDVRARLERERGTLDPEERARRESEVARQQEIARAYRTSQELLRERNVYTFGALLAEAVRELRTNPALLAHYRELYRYILVDEFQDTNIAQIELLWLLAGTPRPGNIVAVGDDDQAIYRFRGASFGSFRLFMEKFAAHASCAGVPPTVALTRNYRSTQRILHAAAHTIAQNKDRFIRDKSLTTGNPLGAPVVVAEFATFHHEACWVAEEIRTLHRAGHRWKEFAVLYRAHHHRDLLVKELVRRRIPFVIRNLSVLDYAIVRDVMAYLRLIVAPSDDVACARVLAAPAWGLEAADLVRLAERASRSRGISLWDALLEARAEPPLAERFRRTAQLVVWFAALRQQLATTSASELTEELLGELLAGLDLLRRPTPAEQRALERFVSFVAEWERKTGERSMREFVPYLEYFEEAGGRLDLEEEATDDAVQLMTVHAAKGLEFDHVFVIRLVHKAFPTWRRRPVLEFPPELMKEAQPEGDFHVQEERRLFYVAITRARKRLTLTTVINKRSRPSAFVEELLEPGPHRPHVHQVMPEVVLPAEMPDAAPAALFAEATMPPRVCSRITEWAREYRPPIAERLQLSPTGIDIYRTCPQKFLFQHLWRLPGEPQAQLTFGSVMHKSIREFVEGMRRGRRLPFEELTGIYERAWSSAGFRDDYQEEEYKRAGLEQLERFYHRYLANPPEVLYQERRFELLLDDNIVISGRMDQVNRTGPAQVEIVDYKTGRPKQQRDANESLQLSVYALAARDELNLEPARLVFFNLITGEPVVSTRDEKELNEALAIIQEVAASIRAGAFAPEPGYYCRSCDYRSLCPAQEERATLPQEEA